MELRQSFQSAIISTGLAASLLLGNSGCDRETLAETESIPTETTEIVSVETPKVAPTLAQHDPWKKADERAFDEALTYSIKYPRNSVAILVHEGAKDSVNGQLIGENIGQSLQKRYSEMEYAVFVMHTENQHGGVDFVVAGTSDSYSWSDLKLGTKTIGERVFVRTQAKLDLVLK